MSTQMFTVFVGGTEVNDNYLSTEEEAEKLAYQYKEDGYLDVCIYTVAVNKEILKEKTL